MCTSPLHGYRAPDGRVVFNPNDGWRDRPFTVACGQCIECRLERSRQWAVRCMHEASMHDANCFVTLTYDDAHLPSDGSLCLDDWQTFIRNLRKSVGRVRYFHCGEYGDRRGRPHYHACLFGVDFAHDRKFARMSKSGERLYQSPTLERAWGFGFADVGDLTFESAAYVARYCVKKVLGDGADAHYGGRKPEYATMSRRPGLGHSWAERWINEYGPRDSVIVRGVECRLPKYYDRFLEDLDPRAHERRKARRKRGFREVSQEKLDVRDKVRRARLGLSERGVD